MFGRIVIQCLISVLIFCAAIAAGVRYQLDRSNDYFSVVFERMDARLKEIGDANAKTAWRLEQSLSNHVLESEIGKPTINSVMIYAYPERNEFGFNQGVFADTTPNGSLVGYGKPTSHLLAERALFLKLDKVWNYTRDQIKVSDKFFIHYRHKYIYTSTLVHDRNQGVEMTAERFDPLRFRRHLEGDYQEDIKKNGYFYSTPYLNLLKNNRVISAISPVHDSKGQEIGDLGVDLDIDKFKDFFFLHPDYQGFVNVLMTFRHSDYRVNLIDPTTLKNKYFVAQYKYSLPYVGAMVVQYNILFFVAQLSYFVLALIVTLSVINYGLWKLYQQSREGDDLREQLNLDPMTNLYNRRLIDDLQILIDDTESRGNTLVEEHFQPPMGLMALDANRFKQINDNYGHQVGDEAILAIAQAMRSCTRGNDYCIRMGGDEFIILVQKASPEVLAIVAQRIHNYLRRYKIPGAPELLRVDVSIAYDLIQTDEGFEAAYKRVDKMLYDAKGGSMTGSAA